MLPDWLHQRTSLTPDRLALVVGDLHWSFRDLDQQATEMAQRLSTLSLSIGDRVALLLWNGAPFVTLVHALSRLGLVLVPLNTRLTPAEVRWQLFDARARLLIYDEVNAQSAIAATHDLPELRLLLLDRWPHHLPPLTSHLPPPTSFSLAAIHTLLYTSGTTGYPKGALLTYGNHWWSAMGSALNLGLHADDRWLACLPLFHVGGLAILLRGVIYGNTVIVHETFDPAAVNRAIDEEGVTSSRW